MVCFRQHGCSPKLNLDGDKKVRREIANSNERRRMQSINAGFQSLRNLIPHHEGEKLSKVGTLFILKLCPRNFHVFIELFLFQCLDSDYCNKCVCLFVYF